jgi:hypothetical protein
MTLTPVLINFDRESFTTLKDLLYDRVFLKIPNNEPAGDRLTREALKRVFDQIRDLQYGSESRPVSLDHE